jgi:hypothetical protein
MFSYQVLYQSHVWATSFYAFLPIPTKDYKLGKHTQLSKSQTYSKTIGNKAPILAIKDKNEIDALLVALARCGHKGGR